MASSDRVTAYRICSPRWASTAMSGEGARLEGGRWNSPGRPMVYLATTRALCALELLVHLTTPEARAKAFVIIEVTLPADAIESCPIAALPKGWDLSPPTPVSQRVGDEWATAGHSLALRVPSTIIPEETNLVLNSAHRQMRDLVISEPTPFRFDERFVY